MMSASSAESATTLLFVPGDRPERFEKALASGADLVVLDLEDAVVPDRKELARGRVGDFARDHPGTVVRVNAVATPWHSADLALLRGLVLVVMLPKVETADMVGAVVTDLPGTPVIALVESAKGVLNVPEIANSPGIARLAFGSYDFAAEIGADPDDRHAMAAARGHLVLASAAAGLSGPIDGVTGSVDDDERLRSDVNYAKRLGFTGKLCIHPQQVASVVEVMSPSLPELAWASGVLEAAASRTGEGVFTYDGHLVDKPVLQRATRIAARGAIAVENLPEAEA